MTTALPGERGREEAVEPRIEDIALSSWLEQCRACFDQLSMNGFSLPLQNGGTQNGGTSQA